MKVRLDKNDIIWEVISILLLLTNTLLIVWTLPSLPDTVAVHFDSSHQANGWGNKNMLWTPLVIATTIYAFLTFVSFRPWLYKFRMTNKNLDEQYKLTSKMARTVKAFILLAFIGLTIFMLKSAEGKLVKQFPLVVLIFFGLVVPPCLYYANKISKVQ